MLYLSGCLPSKPDVRAHLFGAGVGLMLTPVSQRTFPVGESWVWAADNACFGDRWDEAEWLRWLGQLSGAEGCLFATVPDVVGDWVATLDRWPKHYRQVTDLGYEPAFVLQDGISVADVPWDALGAVFVGGSTGWKLSEHARIIVAEAKSRHKWVHMGRVNSFRRMELARAWGCDSVDGTYIAFGPDVNTPKLVKMLERLKNQHALF